MPVYIIDKLKAINNGTFKLLDSQDIAFDNTGTNIESTNIRDTIIEISGNGFSGSYNDLTNLPTIPTDVEDLTDTTSLLFDKTYDSLTNKPDLSLKADLVSGKIPASQLPSFVDEVLEYDGIANFPASGETSKIYIDTSNNTSYRWGGTTYVSISQSISLGETEVTAYRGDRGAAAYNHSQAAHAPSNANYYVHPSVHPASVITQTSSARFVTDTEKSSWTDHVNTSHAPSSAQKNSDITQLEIEAKLTGLVDTHTHAGLAPGLHASEHVTGVDVIPDAVAVGNSGLMSGADKDKLDGIAVSANNYSHPSTHPASMITQNSNARFVTDAEKDFWTAKSSLHLGTTGTTAYRGDLGETAYNHSQAAHAPSNAQKNSNITKAEIEAKLTGPITSHEHSIDYSVILNPPDIEGVSHTNRSVIDLFEQSGLNLTWNGSAIGLATNQFSGMYSDLIDAPSLNLADLPEKSYDSLSNKPDLSLKADLVGGKIPSTQLPSFVDDVLEYTNSSAFPATGETDKIYVAKNTNIIYRWSGTQYVEISSTLALGVTEATAYRGDLGAAAYTHSQVSHAPSNAQKNSDITKGEIENKLTGAIDTHTHTGLLPGNHAANHVTGGFDIIPEAIADVSNGLMSIADKTKLDGISTNANNYALSKQEIESKLTGSITTHTHPNDSGWSITTDTNAGKVIYTMNVDYSTFTVAMFDLLFHNTDFVTQLNASSDMRTALEEYPNFITAAAMNE